jgi:hypothetical protein
MPNFNARTWLDKEANADRVYNTLPTPILNVPNTFWDTATISTDEVLYLSMKNAKSFSAIAVLTGATTLTIGVTTDDNADHSTNTYVDQTTAIAGGAIAAGTTFVADASGIAAKSNVLKFTASGAGTIRFTTLNKG